MKNKFTKAISILILLLSSSYEVYASSYPMIQHVVIRGKTLAGIRSYSCSFHEVVKQAIQELTIEELDQYLKEWSLYAQNKPNDKNAQEIAKAYAAYIQSKQKLNEAIEMSDVMQNAQRFRQNAEKFIKETKVEQARSTKNSN